MAEEDTSPKITKSGKKLVQAILGTLLYYFHNINNKILVGLSAIGAQQSAATKKNTAAIDQILDHVATYTNNGITHRTIDIVLAAHSYDGFNKDSKSWSHAGDHIFLSEDTQTPKWNGAVLTIAQIIKFVMLSAAEAEIGALYITAKEMIPVHQIIIEMVWKKPPYPIQTDELTSEGVINNTIMQHKRKSMDLHFHWLRSIIFRG